MGYMKGLGDRKRGREGRDKRERIIKKGKKERWKKRRKKKSG